MDATHQVKVLNTTDGDDAWGQVHDAANVAILHAKQKAAPVRDAWDDDDDGEVEADQLDSPTNAKELWERANSSIPLPQIMHSATVSSMNVALPPAAALQGPLRILKRPSATTTSSNNLSTPQSTMQTRKSFEEREAQYQAARARIFGDSVDGTATSSPNTSRAPSPSPSLSSNAKTNANPKAKSPPPRSVVIRNPVGPGASESKQGFTGRRKKGQGSVEEGVGDAGDWNS